MFAMIRRRTLQLRRSAAVATALLLALTTSLIVGCSQPGAMTPIAYDASPDGGTEADPYASELGGDVDPKAMLTSVVQLLRTAATNPGGDNFNIARDYLNQYFSGVRKGDFALSPAAREYLSTRLGPNSAQAIQDLEDTTFTFRDSRHIEDCLLLSVIARRVAGDGDDLTCARRLFDWTVEQVQLIPPGALGLPNLPQAAARPYDVLLRAMATEENTWVERSWVFLALCRQIGLDAALLPFEKPPTAEAVAAAAAATPPAPAPRGDTIIWAVAVLVEGTPYLFDARVGLPIPGPGGEGVATFEQALTDPSILARMDLPGEPYPVHQADLAARGKQAVLLDSTVGLLTPRMRQLQKDLAGRDRMVLHRDVAEIDAAFARALGDRFGGTELWPLPIEVETRLFTDPNFVEASKYALQFFDPSLPLLPARMGQLRGDIAQAVQSYAGFRYAERPVMNDGRTPIPPVVQQFLDFYATYYLGLAKLDQDEPDRAADFFLQTLAQLDEIEATIAELAAAGTPQGTPYFSQYRYGAYANLGRIYDRMGDRDRALRYYAMPQPTGQGHGNGLRIQALLWSTPPFATEPPSTEAAAPAPAVAPG
jgi:hypothetical protein